MTCTFFGHRNVSWEIQPKLETTLVNLIENKDADTFYVGNQGNFDHMVRKTLKSLKVIYPHIKYYIVLAYLPGKKGNCDSDDFEDTIYPEGIESVPRKYAISKRNRWLISHSDTVITYVKYSTGGAAQFKALAEKKGKQIINLVREK